MLYLISENREYYRQWCLSLLTVIGFALIVACARSATPSEQVAVEGQDRHNVAKPEVKSAGEPVGPDWRNIRVRQLASVKSVYQGTISAHRPIEEMPEQVSRVMALMAEWNPIGASEETLLAILGRPTKIENNVLVYRFDTGYGGVVWRFGMSRSNKVSEVQLIGLD